MSSYIPIASQTLGSSAASVTFSSIPTTLNGKTLRDLILVANGIADDVSRFMMGRVNGDSGSNYSYVLMSGNGSAASPSTAFGDAFFRLTDGGSTRKQAIHQIFDFAQTNKHKSMLTRGDVPESHTVAWATRWANTAAVTSITVLMSGGNLQTGSTFSLYGLEG
jgi:hypothetical protein